MEGNYVINILYENGIDVRYENVSDFKDIPGNMNVILIIFTDKSSSIINMNKVNEFRFKEISKIEEKE